MNNYVMTHGAKEFTSKAAFPLGGNTFDYADPYKLTCNKPDTTKAALAVFDLNRVSRGSHVIFEVDIRVVSGSKASMSIDSRTLPSLTSGRKVVGLKEVNNTEWETHRLEWFVVDEYINVNIGGGTTSQGVYEFRNPRVYVDMADSRLCNNASVNLVRLSNVWVIDATNFSVSNGIELVSAAGDTIVLKWAHTGTYAPTVNVTVDSGFSLSSAGFVSAGPNSATEEGCNIKLIKADGSFVTDVNTGGNTRLHVMLTWQ